MPSIFLSHSSRDKFFIRKLAERLQKKGVRVWLDELELNVGDSLSEKITSGIGEVDFVGVVLSHHSLESEWFHREVQLALKREGIENRRMLLPLLLEKIEVPEFLRDKIFADFTSPEYVDAGVERLLRAMGVADDDTIPFPPRGPDLTVEGSSHTPSRERLDTFVDLWIEALDRFDRPDPSRPECHFYLRLSAAPPTEWVDIFEAERRFPRSARWARARVEGEHVIVHCTGQDLERYHFVELRRDVGFANTQYRAYLAELVRRELRELQKRNGDAMLLEALNRNLGLLADVNRPVAQRTR